jgi:hypothetical protein
LTLHSRIELLIPAGMSLRQVTAAKLAEALAAILYAAALDHAPQMARRAVEKLRSKPKKTRSAHVGPRRAA